MFRFNVLSFICLGTLSIFLVSCQQSDLDARLRKDHPRLIFTRDSQERIEKLAEGDTLLQQSIVTLMNLAEQMIILPSVQYKPEGTDQLSISRDCLAKVMTLSMAFRLSGELHYAERAMAEMLAAASFPTWNPNHFLDVAEMSTALAIGYDWLFEVLSDKDRETIRTALIEKGLRAGLEIYPEGFAKRSITGILSVMVE